jgi:hypothetical protein
MRSLFYPDSIAVIDNIMRPMFGIYLAAFMQTVSSCGQKADPETYLIPSSYVGRVEVLFNQNGVPYNDTNEYGQDTVYTPQKEYRPNMNTEGEYMKYHKMAFC